MSTKALQVNISIIHSEEFTAAEAPSAGSVSERTIKSGKGNDAALQLNATSTPALTEPAISRKITIGGAPTVIDLTAAQAGTMPPSATRLVDLTGKKLVAFRLRADPTNDDPVLVGPGASSDTYDLFGTGIDLPVLPGQDIASSFREVASSQPAVAAGVKNVEISGTLDDVIYIDLFFGT